MIISTADARQIILQSQGFLSNHFGEGKDGALAAIEHLGYIQIDTLAVIARAHHHTLWSRTKNYHEKYLTELLNEKKIFEYWSHAASYLPMKHYRYSLHSKKIYVQGKSHWFDQDQKMKKFVLDRIKSEGALQSKDFAHVKKVPGQWYDWKPAKRALEQLFMEGKLMVVTRKNFQKVYDLTERVLPQDIDITMPSEQEYAEHTILSAIYSFGIITLNEICYLRGHTREMMSRNIKRLLKEGIISEIKINHSNKITYYGLQKRCEFLLNNKMKKSEIHILSPFDNVIIQRKRLQTIFDFDYVIECYLPVYKRQYGYFCLPILLNDTFIARIDPKVDRKNKVFYINSFHAEKNWKVNEKSCISLANKIRAFAKFNGCDRVCVNKDTPKQVGQLIQA